MATTDLTRISALLKEVYEDRIPSQLQDEMVFAKRIKPNSKGVSETTGGKYVDFPIVVGRNQGISYRAERETLGNPGAVKTNEVHVPLFYGYGRGEISGQVFELADTKARSFADAVQREMDGLKSGLLKDQCRINYGDGTGLMASSTTADVGVNVVTVDRTYWLEVDMEVDLLVRSTGAAVATGRTITAINATTGAVTLDGAVFTTAVTQGLYRAGNFTAGTKREPNGLASIVSNTVVLHGLDPAVETKWKAGYVEAVGGALSEEKMIRVCDEIRTAGGKVSAIFCSLGVRRAYFGILKSARQFTNTKEYPGGYVGLPFNYGYEIPVIEDPDCPPSTMYFITEDNWMTRHTKDWHFEDKTGSMFTQVSGIDAFQFMMKRYWENGVERRNGNGVLTTLTEA